MYEIFASSCEKGKGKRGVMRDGVDPARADSDRALKQQEKVESRTG